MDYTVRLEAFEGPLDLLLFLIRRAEVEVTDIPISRITDQYLKYLDQFTASESIDGGDAGTPHAKSRPIDIERAGEFLVMAATLMEIKSRMLTPVPLRGGDNSNAEPGEGNGRDKPSDPRSELVRQLLEYKRFRDATEQLEHYRDEYFSRYPAAAIPGSRLPEPEPQQAAEGETEEAPIDLEDTTLIDLVEAFSRIMQTVDFSRVGEHRVVFDDTPVEIHAEDILLKLRQLELPPVDLSGLEDAPRRVRSMEFASVFQGRKRSEAIGLFLAVLELVKQQRIRVVQAQRWESLVEAKPAGRKGKAAEPPAPVTDAEAEVPAEPATKPATPELVFTLELIEDRERERLADAEASAEDHEAKESSGAV